MVSRIDSMTKSVFDLHTDKYDDWFNTHQHAFLTELLVLKKELTNAKKAIEIGVGTARFAQLLNISFGIDISYPMVKIAKRRGCEVAIADAKDLPLRTGDFDFVLLMVTLCFIKYPKRVIKEAKRILTTHGKLIVGIIDKTSELARSYQKKNSIFYNSARFFSTREVIQLLRNNGFYNIRTTQTLFNDPYKMKKIDVFKSGYGEGGFVVITGTK